MIKELLNERETKIAIELCNDILSGSATPEYITKSLDNIDAIIYKIMPEDYVYFDLATHNSILIDDILEMTSISEEEKQKAINDLILSDKEEFTTLAKDILEKIEADEIEAEKSGYCPKLMQIEHKY
jgi:hypothetical protein